MRVMEERGVGLSSVVIDSMIVRRCSSSILKLLADGS